MLGDVHLWEVIHLYPQVLDLQASVEFRARVNTCAVCGVQDVGDPQPLEPPLVHSYASGARDRAWLAESDRYIARVIGLPALPLVVWGSLLMPFIKRGQCFGLQQDGGEMGHWARKQGERRKEHYDWKCTYVKA